MSDSENVEVKKRGRPIAGDKRVAPKKDEKVAVADGESVSKRGRGRPKGTTKKGLRGRKAATKAPASPSKASGGARGRGRPAKKKETSDDDNEENDTEENEEENASGSD